MKTIKFLITLLIVPLLFVSCKAQKQKVNIVDDENTPFAVCQVMPVFGDGSKGAFRNWLNQNVQIPANAPKSSSVVQFIIERDGSVSNVQIYRSLTPECDAEAVRLISSSPKWTPGTQYDKPVRVIMQMPVSFVKSNINL